LVTALRRREQELAHQAYHDPLTGLANRASFVERIEQRVARYDRDGTGVAVLFCDLDDFKDVNDTLGHAAGDALLVEIAARLRAGVRAGDTVARLGGDEFAVLLDHPHGDPGHVAARLVAGVAQPVEIAGQRVPTSVSIGAVVLPTPGTTSDAAGQRVTASQLMATADRAMYHAKADGKGRHVMASADDLDETGSDVVGAVPLPRSPSPRRDRHALTI
ncbi:MAG: diguanylate cyclase domain-containing protein, partial [Actinomycetes bacterium]